MMAETPTVPSAPAPIAAANNGKGTSVLILTLVAGFLSVAIGGCTASFVGGIADMGDSISDFQRELGEHGDASSTRNDAAELREQAGAHAFYGVLQAIVSIAGGVFAYRNYGSAATRIIAGRSFKELTLAASAIAVAALLTTTNTFAFFTAGILNTVAAVLTFLQAKKV